MENMKKKMRIESASNASNWYMQPEFAVECSIPVSMSVILDVKIFFVIFSSMQIVGK